MRISKAGRTRRRKKQKILFLKITRRNAKRKTRKRIQLKIKAVENEIIINTRKIKPLPKIITAKKRHEYFNRYILPIDLRFNMTIMYPENWTGD